MVYEQTRHGYTLRLTVTETATNVDTNKSTLTYSLQLISGNTYHFESFGVGATVTMDGVTVASRSRDTDPYLTIGFNSTLTLLSGSTQITHAADGTKTVSVGYTLNMADRYYTPGSMSGTGSFVCATIPRATQPTVDDNSVLIGANVTISVSGRASASFSHVLSYTVGSASGSIATLNTSTTSYTWTVPASVANQITKATTGIVTIQCTTKNGNTVIGTKSVDISVLVPNTSDYKPSVSGFAVTEENADVIALGLSSTQLVQNKSVISISGNGAGKCGATIVSTEYYVANVKVSSPEHNAITTAGLCPIVLKVTDSRGRITESTAMYTALSYAAPSVSTLTFYRAISGGTASPTGQYLYYSFTGEIASLSGHNTNTWALHVQRAGQSTWTSVASGTGTTLNVSATSSSAVVNADYSYTIRLTLTDSFGSSVFYRELSTGYTTVDYKSGGHGVAIGKASEYDNFVELAPGWGVKYNGADVDFVIDHGFDPSTNWRYRKWKSGWGELWLDMGTVTPTTSTNENGQYYSENLYVYPPFILYPFSLTGITNNYSYICNPGVSYANSRYSFRIGRAEPIATNTSHNLCLYICGDIYEE